MNKSRKTSNLYNIVTYDDSGNVVLPASLTLGTSPASNDNSSKVATTSWIASYISSLSLATSSSVTTAIANLVASAPTTLDTLNELATALGNDPNFATTIASSIGTKANDNAVVKLTGDQTIAGNKTFTGVPKIDTDLLIKNVSGSPSTATGYTSIRGISGIVTGIAYKGISIIDTAMWGASLRFATDNAYDYTFPATSGTVALLSNLTSYLPLSGGILTGGLTGTTATFSSDVFALMGVFTRNSADTFIGTSNNTSGIKVNGSTLETKIVSGGNVVATFANGGAAVFSNTITATQGIFQNGTSGTTISATNTGGGSVSLGISSNATSVATLAFTNSLSLTGGNVGIGTTTDAGYKLDVNGSARVSSTFQVGGNLYGVAATFSNTIDVASIGYFRGANNTTDNIRFYNTDGNYAYIRTTLASNTNNTWFDTALGATLWLGWDNPGQARTANTYSQVIIGTGRGEVNESVRLYRGSIEGKDIAGTITYRIAASNTLGANTFFNYGNVGVGTSSPSDKLHVYSSATTGEIRLGGGNGAGNARMYFQAHATTAYIDMYGNNSYLPLQINASPVSFMGGNVGIGTNNPGVKLDVTSDIRTSTRYLINTGTSGQDMAIGFWDSANARIEAGAAYPMFITSYNGVIKFGPSGTETLRINSTGELSQAVTNAVITQQGYGGYSLLRLYGNSSAVEMQIAAHQTSGVASLGTYTNSDVVFKTNNSERMRLSAGGYLTIADGNLELYKGQTVDMSNTGVYSTANYYPVIIGIPNSGVTIQIQNNLNSNVPSWATHGGGFTLNLKWTTNGSGWGTTAVKRKVYQYHERFNNQRICGGITQMSNSSIEVVWLRGGGIYYFTFSRNLTASPQSSTYSVNYESVSPTSSAVNDVWNAAAGTELYYASAVYADTLYTGYGNGYHVSMKPTTGATFNIGYSSGNIGTNGPFVNATYDGTANTSAVPLYFNCSAFSVFVGYSEKMRLNSNGTLYIGDGIVQYYGSWSDIKLKEDLKIITNPLNKISKLTGYTFKWTKDSPYRNTPAIGERVNDAGLIAQDVEEVLPEVVTETDYKHVNYNGIIALHTEGIKELIKQNEALLARIQELENKLL